MDHLVGSPHEAEEMKIPNKALHLTPTHVMPPAGSLRSLAGVTPRAGVGELEIRQI